tara:strand:+ start:698 stop:847 length:150 start_codon:yes stop_codon:yes gene_type:complete
MGNPMEIIHDPFKKHEKKMLVDENGKRQMYCMIHLKPLKNKICWGCIDE